MSHRLAGLASWIFRRRANPLTQVLEVDDVKNISAHLRTIEANALLRRVYFKRYREFLPAVLATKALDLPRLEIGCGPSHMDRFIGGVIKSDVVAHPNVDRIVDAQKLPFADASLSTIFLTNALHHLGRPELFLEEAHRALAKGGRLVMVEPSNTWLQRLATNLGSPHEYSDSAITEWTNGVTGRMSHANNSIPWVIFVRDRERFARRFPGFKILKIRYHTLVAFYLSGGFNYRPFVPSFLSPLIDLLEWLGQPLCRWMGFEMTVELEKI